MIGSRIEEIWSSKAAYQSIGKMREKVGVKTIRLDKKMKFTRVVKKMEERSE